MHIADLPTPSLLVDADAFSHNVATMSLARPGHRLRPHVKAFKSTALAKELAAAGHRGFCGATARELLGMANAGLGDDLLLANEVLDPAKLDELARSGARITVAVDSPETIRAAARSGIREVLIDVDVGCLRCGCTPEEAGSLAETARAAGMDVRGVMGYEGHLMMDAEATKGRRVEMAMTALLQAHDDVGGDVVSGGGTGTYAVNRWVTELQAGSFTLMDTDYGRLGLPFRQALYLWCTVVSVHRGEAGWAVCDGGLKALGMDHGNPDVPGAQLVYCSDEHTTFVPLSGDPLPAPGDRIRLVPSHVDPTVAYHERLHVVDGDEVVDVWDVDLRNW